MPRNKYQVVDVLPPASQFGRGECVIYQGEVLTSDGVNWTSQTGPLSYDAGDLPDPATLAPGATVVVGDGDLAIINGGLSPMPTSSAITSILVPPTLSKVIVGEGTVTLTIGAVAGASKYEVLINSTVYEFDNYGAKTISGLPNGVALNVSVRAVSADRVYTDYTVWPRQVTPTSHIFSAFDAKLEAWFDADTLTTFPWLDKSGNGCRGNAVNAMTVNNAWANGHKSAVFSGTSSNHPYVQTDVPVTSGVKTLFVVFDITASTNGSSQRGMSILSTAKPIATALDYFYVDTYNASGNALRSLNQAGGTNPAGQVLTAGVVNVLAMNMSGSVNAGFYHNGTKITADLFGIMANNNVWTLGEYLNAANAQLYGNIAEVLIFDGELTNAQRWEVEDYLNTKYTGSVKAHV